MREGISVQPQAKKHDVSLKPERQQAELPGLPREVLARLVP